ncbi:LapA family protein [Colidextribacter sp. OB.20]|uniref:LapA family protein n=1 Tax=Colidextribacter sp. OB.20 TaxID=2304568 RepID=UPI0013704914|nr:LapA family protein [Colidextribacter sp. OB.20]NBI10402.1 LapA family protein [Colidextribacter sp. OB.20]
MTTILIAVGSLVAGVVLGITYSTVTIRRLRRRVKELREIIREGLPPDRPETMKRYVWACVINGFAWVWCSYILAALDKVQIAEELSKVALAEIIVPVAVYAGKSVLENLSKNNRWPDKGDTPEADPEDAEPPGMG